MPAALPDNWTGGFVLLGLVFVISSFLDNIAAALIGATVARHVFKGRVRVGYLAGNCRRGQRRRRGQRHRRHDDDDALDRRRQPAFRASCVCRGCVCAVRLGHPRIACATEIRADRQGSAVRSAHLVQARCRGHHGALPRRSPPMSGRISSTPMFWTRSPSSGLQSRRPFCSPPQSRDRIGPSFRELHVARSFSSLLSPRPP